MTERSMEYRMAELERRLANVVRLGTIEEVDYSGNVPRARIKIGKLKTTWLPLPAGRAGGDRVSWHYEAGEQVHVLSPDGRLENAVIGHAINSGSAGAVSDSADTPRIQFSNGDTIEYDRVAKVLTINVGDKLVINGKTVMNGDVSLIGDLNQTGSHTSTGDQVAGGVSQMNHPHDDVQPGSSLSGPPVATA